MCLMGNLDLSLFATPNLWTSHRVGTTQTISKSVSFLHCLHMVLSHTQRSYK